MIAFHLEGAFAVSVTSPDDVLRRLILSEGSRAGAYKLHMSPEKEARARASITLSFRRWR